MARGLGLRAELRLQVLERERGGQALEDKSPGMLAKTPSVRAWLPSGTTRRFSDNCPGLLCSQGLGSRLGQGVPSREGPFGGGGERELGGETSWRTGARRRRHRGAHQSEPCSARRTRAPPG